MPDSLPARLISKRCWASVPGRVLLPSGFQERIFASWADAKPSVPVVPVKGELPGIFSERPHCVRLAEIIHVKPLRAFDMPDYRARLVNCIGCEYAAFNQRRKLCPNTKIPQRRSGSSPLPPPSGATKAKMGSSTASPSSVATRTIEATSILRPLSTRAMRYSSRRSSISSIRRSENWLPSSGRRWTLTTKNLHSRRSGHGVAAITPAFFLLPTEQWKGRALFARPCSVGAFDFQIVPRTKCGNALVLGVILSFIPRREWQMRGFDKLCVCPTILKNCQQTRLQGGFAPVDPQVQVAKGAA